MKKHLGLLSVMLFLQATAVSVFAQDTVQHEYVDLGLSVKWATCNVGADKPEDFGDYYAWASTSRQASTTPRKVDEKAQEVTRSPTASTISRCHSC